MDIDLCIVEPIKFSSFHSILEKLPEFKQFLREIKLNTILDGKKIQFDINEIVIMDSHFFGKYINAFDPESLLDMSSISRNSDFRVESLSFIIEGDNVISVKSKIVIIGDMIEHLIEEGLKVELYPLLVNGRVSKFYLIKA